MSALLGHMRALWPRHPFLPAAPFAAWAFFWFARGDFRWEHVALLIVVCVLAYTNQRSKRLYLGLLPIGLVALLYDGMRFVQNWGLTEDNIHVCDLREAELRWFGIESAGVRMTLQDYFLQNWHLAADVLCAIPYGAFIPVILVYAVYLFFVNFEAQQQFTWTFLLLNVAGFITYHVYPAAPPWYFHAHGCEVNLAVGASEGPNLARVDAFLGIEYFRSFYGRSSDVFGAVPSLHVAYPLTIVLAGWRRHTLAGRTASVLFYLWMCFSAVYLDHHWVIDIVLGSIYAIAATALVSAVFQSREVPLREPVASPANLGESR